MLLNERIHILKLLLQLLLVGYHYDVLIFFHILYLYNVSVSIAPVMCH